MRGKNWSPYLDSLHRFSIELGGLVQVANRRDPRASRSAPTSDGAARVGGACLPTWASPGWGSGGGVAHCPRQTSDYHDPGTSIGRRTRRPHPDHSARRRSLRRRSRSLLAGSAAERRALAHSLRAYGYDVVVWVRFSPRPVVRPSAGRVRDVAVFHRARRRADPASGYPPPRGTARSPRSRSSTAGPSLRGWSRPPLSPPGRVASGHGGRRAALPPATTPMSGRRSDRMFASSRWRTIVRSVMSGFAA